MRKNAVRDWFWDVVGAYCRKCGYNKSAAALHAHHLDPSQKIGNTDSLAKASQSGFENLAAWVHRTDFIILCANCHAELHDGMWTTEGMLSDSKKLGTMAFLADNEETAAIQDNILSGLPDSLWAKIKCHNGKPLTMQEKLHLTTWLPLILSKIPISKRRERPKRTLERSR
jgi:hypothetical protein